MSITETKGERKRTTTTKQNSSNSSYLAEEVSPQMLCYFYGCVSSYLPNRKKTARNQLSPKNVFFLKKYLRLEEKKIHHFKAKKISLRIGSNFLNRKVRYVGVMKAKKPKLLGKLELFLPSKNAKFQRDR